MYRKAAVLVDKPPSQSLSGVGRDEDNAAGQANDDDDECGEKGEKLDRI